MHKDTHSEENDKEKKHTFPIWKEFWTWLYSVCAEIVLKHSKKKKKKEFMHKNFRSMTEYASFVQIIKCGNLLDYNS